MREIASSASDAISKMNSALAIQDLNTICTFNEEVRKRSPIRLQSCVPYMRTLTSPPLDSIQLKLLPREPRTADRLYVSG